MARRRGHPEDFAYDSRSSQVSSQKNSFAEADQLDVIKAAQIVHEEGIGIPILLGNKKVIKKLMQSIDFSNDVTIIDPKTDEHKKVAKSMQMPFGKVKKKR